MSHQTGIQANAELKKYFAKIHDGKIRVIKVVIENEELTMSKSLPAKGTWEQDFDKYVPDLIEPDLPCYILYRFDTVNSLGYEWLLLTWSPDTAAVRNKMLYASTKATLKMEFGSAHFTDDLHATSKDEATLSGYRSHLSGVAAPAPLTQREEALKDLLTHTLTINMHDPDFTPHNRPLTLGGVLFPLTDAARCSLQDFRQHTCNYLQFKIDIEKEHIDLVRAAKLEASLLSEQVPSDQARYHLFVFSHSHEGDHLNSVVFIYSMPGYSCSIKERMLYSSCKGQFLEVIQQAGIEVTKRLEIDDGQELTEEFLKDEIHPKVNLHRPAFAKPKGPPNRGAKRITKPLDS